MGLCTSVLESDTWVKAEIHRGEGGAREIRFNIWQVTRGWRKCRKGGGDCVKQRGHWRLRMWGIVQKDAWRRHLSEGLSMNATNKQGRIIHWSKTILYKDTTVCVTLTPEVLTPVCSDILRWIQVLQSKSTYSALVSLPHRGWNGDRMRVCMCMCFKYHAITDGKSAGVCWP